VGAGLILAGSLGLFILIKWEAKTKSPLVDLNLFRKNRVFAFSNLAALIHYSASSAVTFILSLYLQYTKGLSPQSAGLLLVSQPVIMTLISPFAGRLSDRVEPRIVASIGMSATVMGLFLLSLLSEKTPLSYIVASLMVLGLGYALFSSPNINSIMSSVDTKFFGIASAITSTMRQSGQMLSMGLVTVIFSISMGRVQITPEYYGLFLKGSKLALSISALLCFIGIFASLARGKR
jgi:nitrate/nitrite transporter NarK